MQRSSWLTRAAMDELGASQQWHAEGLAERGNACDGVHEEVKWKRRTLPCVHARRDKVAMAHGPATNDGDWCWLPLCRVGGQCLVIGSVAGGSGIGHRLPQSKLVLGRDLWARPSYKIFQY
jgi:hypothetical protein